MPKVIVLFEDKRLQPRGAALDQLVWACLEDITGKDRWSFKGRVELRFRKGNANVLEDVRHLEDLAPSGETVFAVFDRDGIHGCVKVKPSASDAAVIKAIEKECDQATRLRVVLLTENMESLLEAIRDCLNQHAPASAQGIDWPAAIGKKRLAARDRALGNAASAVQAVRDCVRTTLRSFGALVSSIAAFVG